MDSLVGVAPFAYLLGSAPRRVLVIEPVTLRQGIQTLKAQRSVFGMLAKRKDSILQSAGLLEEEYAQLSRGELELKIKSQWGKVEQSA